MPDCWELKLNIGTTRRRAARSCGGLAAEHGLLMTGSSDYHGAGKPNLLGENTTSPEVLARIEELATGSTVIR